MKKLSIPALNPFNWALILAIVLLNIISAVLLGQSNLIAAIASIAGVIGVVLSARGHLLCYLFWLIEVILYIVISWEARFYGEVMLNGFYFLPMQFIGFYNWRKNTGSENLVKAHSLNKIKRIYLFIISIVISISYGLLLDRIDSNIPYLDAGTTVLSIIAMLLMVRAFVEQWWLWIMVDLLTTVKWIIALTQQEPNAGIMIGMWSIFLINSIYGYFNWKKTLIRQA